MTLGLKNRLSQHSKSSSRIIMNKSVNMSPDHGILRKSSSTSRKLSAKSSSPNHSRRSSDNKDSSRLKVI